MDRFLGVGTLKRTSATLSDLWQIDSIAAASGGVF